MKRQLIANTKHVLSEDMKKYVQIILKEYKAYIPARKQEKLKLIQDFKSKISIEDSGTISMFATDYKITMPLRAYTIFRYMKFIPGYGINKKHKSYIEGEIINHNTYFDYIKHVFISGMSVEDFFRDSLLHEIMHFCGTGGESAIREGITELKTRELAQKYSLKASRCGYPKEVGIAKKLQKIVGEDIMNRIAFAQNNNEIISILNETCGPDVANLFIEISYDMDIELMAKYDHSKFDGILGPIKKANAYSKIDYSRIHKKLDKFKNNNPILPYISINSPNRQMEPRNRNNTQSITLDTESR